MKKLYLFLFLIIIAAVGYGQFTNMGTNIPGTFLGSCSWGDYDNDGDLDVLIAGNSYQPGIGIMTRIYRNDGNEVFTDLEANLMGVTDGSSCWGDYDNDGDLDILLTGWNGDIIISKVYRNDSNGVFTDINANLTACSGSYGSNSIAWGDYNNDGRLDILLTGRTQSNIYVSKIYRNNGNGLFTDINASLPGVFCSSVEWGDFDNDCDLDILLCGITISGNLISKIYRNDGNGNFIDINANLTGINNGTVAWGDYDNDGYLDALLSGGFLDNGRITLLYHNNGNGSFTEINTNIPGACYSSIAWGDYDNDGYIDILITGEESNHAINAKVYRNNGNSSFTNVNTGLTGIHSGAVAWGDYDNDGDIDILTTGYSGNFVTSIYRNDYNITNTLPTYPLNLHTAINENEVTFSWDSSNDAETPSIALNYILRIGTTSGGSQLLSPMANATGYRLLPKRGFANSNCSWKILRSALPDSFYWSVQAVDGAYQGSQFTQIGVYVNLLSSLHVSFGSVYIGSQSESQIITLRNIGTEALHISSLDYYHNYSQFEVVGISLPLVVLPGNNAYIPIHFAPTTVGAANDTLYIVSNAVNTPVLKIHLSGTGTYVPPAVPQNISVVMQGNNAVVNWDAVTTDIHGNAIVPDCYIVLYNETPYEDAQFYYYLCYTDQLSYSHIGVGRFRPQMYYRVIAYKDYSRGNLSRLAELNETNLKISYKDLGIE